MTKEINWEESSGNVFAHLEPHQPEELLAKSKLLYQVSTLIKNSKLYRKKLPESLASLSQKFQCLWQDV